MPDWKEQEGSARSGGLEYRYKGGPDILEKFGLGFDGWMNSVPLNELPYRSEMPSSRKGTNGREWSSASEEKTFSKARVYRRP